MAGKWAWLLLVLQPFYQVIECQVVPASSSGLLANFDSGGLRGQIEFLNDPKGTRINVLIRGGTYGEKFRWKIHEFPAIPGTKDPCSDGKVGRTFVDFTEKYGPLTSGQDILFLSPLKLSDSILGRSLVLRSPETGRVACSIIQPTSRIRTFQATLYTPLGGQVTIRQNELGTGFFGTLWYANGTRRDSLHRWAVVGGGCQNPTPFFPIPGHAAVGREPHVITGRTYSTSATAPLLDVQSAYLVIYSDLEPTAVLACARLWPLEPRQAVATFTGAVSGQIAFRQESPFDPTLVTINLEQLKKKAHSYGIDELPLIRRGNQVETCPNIKASIYNPLQKSPDAVPEPRKGTTDQYAVGDLSGKYGPLSGLEKHFRQLYDPQLSLFGVHSVVGRALVIYYPDGAALDCANIELSNRRLITAFATFDFPLQGQLILRQDRDSPAADASLYLELSYPAGAAQEMTYHHSWHVNERALATQQRFSLSGSECLQAGAIFNPHNVSLEASYISHCSGGAPQRCQMGDLSGKLGYLEIPPFGIQGNKQQIARYFFTDPSLSLTSVIGRSVVIDQPDFGTGHLACANIFEHSES